VSMSLSFEVRQEKRLCYTAHGQGRKGKSRQSRLKHRENAAYVISLTTVRERAEEPYIAGERLAVCPLFFGGLKGKEDVCEGSR
jgi:hypothetical protein